MLLRMKTVTQNNFNHMTVLSSKYVNHTKSSKNLSIFRGSLPDSCTKRNRYHESKCNFWSKLLKFLNETPLVSCNSKLLVEVICSPLETLVTLKALFFTCKINETILLCVVATYFKRSITFNHFHKMKMLIKITWVNKY